MDDEAFSLDSRDWFCYPPIADDSWLDEEIEEEQDADMRHILQEVKQSMRLASNERKREYISDQKKRILERRQYANDINTTQVRACMSSIFSD